MPSSLVRAQKKVTGIWRVNNNPGKSCDFTNLTDALRSSAVKVGDTIHIEGSVTPYGKTTQASNNCDTVRKRLVIIGPGYQLSDNPETQHNKESAKVRTLHILPAAAGTVIAGLEQLRPGTAATPNTNLLMSAYSLRPVRESTTNTEAVATNLWGNQPDANKLRIEADSVVVTHCKLYYVDLFNTNKELTNITVTKCLFNPGMIAISGNKTVNNLIVSNNFFRNDYAVNANWYCYPFWHLVLSFFRHGDGINMANNGNGPAVYNLLSPRFYVVAPTIQNNTFYNAANLGVKAGRLYNNIFFYKVNYHYAYGLPVWPDAAHEAHNNIIYNGTGNNSYWGSPVAAVSADGFSHYTSNYGGMLNDAENSYINITETTWFASSTTLPALDKSFILGATSPARDGGDDVKQRGMYGGLSPYILSGLYTIPAVWEISIPAYPSGEVPSTGFEVRVKVKSH
jgi:hypothetical protein